RRCFGRCGSAKSKSRSRGAGLAPLRRVVRTIEAAADIDGRFAIRTEAAFGRRSGHLELGARWAAAVGRPPRPAAAARPVAASVVVADPSRSAIALSSLRIDAFGASRILYRLVVRLGRSAILRRADLFDVPFLAAGRMLAGVGRREVVAHHLQLALALRRQQGTGGLKELERWKRASQCTGDARAERGGPKDA